MGLIKQAQILSTLTESEKQYYTEIAAALGGNQSLVETAEEFSGEITPLHYKQWLDEVTNIINNNEFKSGGPKQPVFIDIVFAVLDDDPMMDVVGNNEETKEHIANTLWHTYSAQNAHTRVRTSSQTPPTEENEEVMNKGKNKDLAFMQEIHNSPILQKVYAKGVTCGQQDAGNSEEKPQKCPYTRGTLRDKVWSLGYKHGCFGK